MLCVHLTLCSQGAAAPERLSPMHAVGVQAFREVVDVPLVVRHPRKPRGEVPSTLDMCIRSLNMLASFRHLLQTPWFLK